MYQYFCTALKYIILYITVTYKKEILSIMHLNNEVMQAYSYLFTFLLLFQSGDPKVIEVSPSGVLVTTCLVHDINYCSHKFVLHYFKTFFVIQTNLLTYVLQIDSLRKLKTMAQVSKFYYEVTERDVFFISSAL